MESLLVNISTKLKSLRYQKNWSLDVASKQTGVSKAMLGQIERQESMPTISTLWKIASGFNVSFSLFMEDACFANSDFKTVRSPNLRKFHEDDEKFLVRTLFPFNQALSFETFIITLLPGCQRLSPPHQAGVVEHVIVTKGELEIFTDGAWQGVLVNQGFAFLADKPHGYRNLSKELVEFVDIIHYKEKH